MALITGTAEQFGTGVKKHGDEHKVLFGISEHASRCGGGK